MRHITLSVTEEVYGEMKDHPEINWSEIARESIRTYAELLKNAASSEELRKMLPLAVISKLKSVPEARARKFRSEVERKEWERIKSLTQTS